MSRKKKKKTAARFLNPEYFRLNRQVIIETVGPITEGVTSESLLRVINEMVALQKLQFLATFCSV